MLLKFFKFVIVGFTGLIVDYFFTYLFKEKVKINRFIANSIGFSMAATNNYILNRWWTFNSHYSNVTLEYTTFFIVSLIGLVINNFFLYLFEKRLNFYIAKFFAIVITTVWNFFANYFFTFNLQKFC